MGLQSGLHSANAKASHCPKSSEKQSLDVLCGLCIYICVCVCTYIFYFTDYNSCDQLIQEITQLCQFTKSKYVCSSKNANWYELISSSGDIMAFH